MDLMYNQLKLLVLIPIEEVLCFNYNIISVNTTLKYLSHTPTYLNKALWGQRPKSPNHKEQYHYH